MGANLYKRAKNILWICLFSVLTVGAVAVTAMYLAGPALLEIYIPDSLEAIRWGMVRISCLCLPYCLCGMMDVSTSALRGMGASVAPMIISVLGVWGIRIGWIYMLFQRPRFHTPQCLYYSYAVSWTVTFAIQMVAFFIIYRRNTMKKGIKLVYRVIGITNLSSKK